MSPLYGSGALSITNISASTRSLRGASATSLTYALLFDARNLALSNGASVATWADTSGNGRDATQGTGASQPVYNSTGINGLPSVTFDGTKFLATTAVSPATLSASGLWTVFIVAKPTTTPGTYSMLDQDTGGTVRNFQNRVNAAVPQFECIAFNSTPSAFTDIQAGGGGTAAHVYSAVRDTTTVQTWVDGTSGGATATTGSAQTTATTAAVILGASGTGSTQRYTGELGYLALVQGAVSSSQRAATEAALKAIWGTP